MKAHTHLIAENHLRQTVVEMAKALGWRVYTTWISVHSPAGFPDLVLVRPPRLIFAELKREPGKEKGQSTSDQYEWLADLQACEGVEAFLWRPSDREQVEKVLRGNRVE